jgi:predicted hotdog family 3-hydroxylacyl-ACP dehydratase
MIGRDEIRGDEVGRDEIGRNEILRLVPHQGAMCLWDEVLEWDDSRIRLRAGNHRAPDHPLRQGGRLHGVHLCEYGAQAMAVHGGLLARSAGHAPRPGMLVALRNVELAVVALDPLDGMLEGEAELIAGGDSSQQYAFRVLHAGSVLVSGRAAVMLAMPDQYP